MVHGLRRSGNVFLSNTTRALIFCMFGKYERIASRRVLCVSSIASHPSRCCLRDFMSSTSCSVMKSVPLPIARHLSAYLDISSPVLIIHYFRLFLVRCRSRHLRPVRVSTFVYCAEPSHPTNCLFSSLAPCAQQSKGW